MKEKLKVAVTALALCSCFVLGACSSGSETNGSEVSISYWNLNTGADGATMKSLVEQFNEEHKGKIYVTPQSVNEEIYYSNLESNIPIGRGPDVAILHSFRVQSYANQGLIIPADELIESAQIDMNDFPAQIVESLEFEGNSYAIPFDMHPLGIYYNKTLLASYGCEVPTNREELLAAAKKADNEDGKVWGLPLSTRWPSEYTYTTALHQFGGVEILPGDQPGFNTQAGKDALASLASLIHTEKISPESLGNDQDLALFRAGKALFHIQGSWMLNSIKKSSIDFGIIPLSRMFNSQSDEIAVRSHTFVFPKQRKENAQKREAAVEFVKWMVENSGSWAEAGQIPASQKARDSEAYKALPYVHDFGDIANFRIGVSSPYYFEAYTPVYSCITDALQKPNYDVDSLFAAAEIEGQKLVKELKELLGK